MEELLNSGPALRQGSAAGDEAAGMREPLPPAGPALTRIPHRAGARIPMRTKMLPGPLHG
jgi:hypothetical protein